MINETVGINVLNEPGAIFELTSALRRGNMAPYR